MAERDAYEVLGLLPSAHDLVIVAAFRALAGVYHPDRQASAGSNVRMAELNLAYARIRTPERRALYDAERQLAARDATFVAPASGPATSPMRGDGKVITFGRYEGWSIDRLAKHDPDYLRWLSRHSSGLRYRAEIEQALKALNPEPSFSERLRERRSASG